MKLTTYIKDLGVEKRFTKHFPDVDTKAWPGREFMWAWCHPIWTFLVLWCFVWSIVGLIESR